MPWIVVAVSLLLWGIPLCYPALGSSMTAHDVERLAELALLLAAATLWAWRSRRTQCSAAVAAGVRSPLVLAAWVLGGLVLASTLHSAVPSVALRELLLFAGLWSLARLLAACIIDVQVLRTALRALALGTFAHAALTLLMIGMSALLGTLGHPWEALIGFDNPRFLNHVQTIALPLVTAAATWDVDARWRRLAWATLLLSGMLLFVTFGRATLLALFVGLLTALLVFRRRAWPYAANAAVPTLLGMGAMWLCYLVWLQTPAFTIVGTELAKPHMRDFLIEQALIRWQSSPWLGVGPMHFAHWYNGEATHPHNIYLQVLAEYGAPAAVLIFGLVGRWLYRMLRSLLQAPAPHVGLAVGLWGAGVGLFVDAGFSGNFVMPLPQLWVAMALGLSWAFRDQVLNAGVELSPASDVRARGRAMIFVRWLVVAGLLWLNIQSWRAVWENPEPRLPTPGAVDFPEDGYLANPRFWTVGWF